MAIFQIDAACLTAMFSSGVHALQANKAWINELNVFPVPDGDTGTNMCMTLETALREVQGTASGSMAAVAKAISFGSLRGARGNSGVIMSQLLRGFCKEIQDGEKALDGYVLACACARAVETAYKAVMKPKEGTILTVARAVADKIAELSEKYDDLEQLISDVLDYGDAALSRTPELLPVLKEAGVVDSGGQGLMVFLRGGLAALQGKPVAAPAAEAVSVQPQQNTRTYVNTSDISTSDIKFGYCTEFLINLVRPLTAEEESSFRGFLENLGDSIVMVADEEIVKVHVHTNDPGLALQKALTFGGLTNIKIDNMRFEHEERLIADASRIAAEEKAREEAAEKPRKPYGFIAASVGAGLTEIFKDLGVDHVVEGGQTMNPSTEDILEAVESVHAETVYILPNNSNIILAAEQAKALTADCRVIVIPSKTIPQGISAMMGFLPEKSPEENENDMTEALSAVRSGEITYAVRTTHLAGRDIHEGDIMGLGGADGLYAVGKEVEETALATVEAMTDEMSGLITLYYGDQVGEEDAERLCDKLRGLYSDCDVQMLNGGQPIYYYIISVE